MRISAFLLLVLFTAAAFAENEDDDGSHAHAFDNYNRRMEAIRNYYDKRPLPLPRELRDSEVDDEGRVPAKRTASRPAQGMPYQSNLPKPVKTTPVVNVDLIVPQVTP